MKKEIGKRLLRIMLTLALVFTMMPIVPGAVQKVEAAETETINITGLDLNPVVGQAPDITATCDATDATIYVAWYQNYNKENEKRITGNFEAGMEDVACIVRIYKSYIADDVTATINGNNYYISFRSSDEIEFTIAFGSISAQVPDTIEITGLDQDVSANEVLDTTVSVNTNVATCEVQWTDKKSGETLTKAEYYDEPKVRLVVRPIEGYSFTSSPKLKINGTLVEASKLSDSEGMFLVYIKEFSQIVPSADKIITQVGVTGSAIDRNSLVIGQAPVLDYTCLDNRVNFDCWYEDDITGNKITKFAAGQQVSLKFEITPKGGYVFPDGEKVELYVNGDWLYVHDSSTYKKATAWIPFGELLYSDIESLNINDYTKPSPNHAPDTEFGLSDTNVASANFAWTDSNGNSVTKFEAGKTYTCTATFVGKSGHGFSSVANIRLMYKGIPYIKFDQSNYVLTDYNNKLVATAAYTIPADAAEEHIWDAATCTTPKTCKGCGTTEGSKLGHSYTNACDKSCNRSGCGATRSITHSYKTTTTKATLSNNGKTVKACTVCGYVSSTKTIYYPKTFKLSTSAYTYNGEVRKPSVTVKDSKGNTLVKDTDYTVSYESGRKAPGKYTVKITFKGKYEGTKRLYFTIAPKKVSGVSASQTTTTITLKWKKQTGADGYRIYKYNSSTKKYEKLKDVTGTSYKISKLKAGTGYKFKVRAYTKDDGTIWGSYSDVFATATKCKTPSITKISSTTKGKAALTWSNVSGESGYQVYYSSKKNSGYKKVASYKVNVVKGSKSKLTSGKTYYFKVRAYKKTDSGTVYSSWSTVKSIKIK